MNIDNSIQLDLSQEDEKISQSNDKHGTNNERSKISVGIFS